VGGLDWTDLVQDRKLCRAIVNVIINVQSLSNDVYFLTS
jgi:hypothetical protein